MYAHFITFPVASTNIFPLVNSIHGGQLITEYNLKSRDIVANNPAIKYAQGPSFIHSLDDFKVKLYEDPETGTAASTSILQIDPGKAVVNGHFIESLAPITIDLAVANVNLQQNSETPLYGSLSIGLKTYFSTESTMSGAMEVENTDDMYVGIQVVIAKTSEFLTPDDCPTNRDDVVADLKLADFTFVNGSISPSSILQNENATRYIPSDRIHDFDSILNDKYVTSENLVDRMFYTYSGKSGWCDSTDNLMIWDADSAHRQTTVPPTVTEANFYTDINGNVHFIIPHKQQDGVILNDNDERVYYADRDILFPTANYTTGSSGVVTAEYTQKIKDLETLMRTYKEFTNGKQIMYVESLTRNADGTLSYTFPTDLSNYNVGDYILVRSDYTIYTGSATDGSAPSTMYFVLPGVITSVMPDTMTTTKPAGMRLGNPVGFWEGKGDVPPTTENPTAEDLITLFNYTTYRGTTDDYFEIIFYNIDDTVGTSYYYPVSAVGAKSWSEAVLLTGGTHLATTTQVGGFYNVPNTATDAGYVILDDTGHLRLVDYALLRSGTLAYQLGSDFRAPTNMTLAFVQSTLDENVNARIAFPFQETLNTTPSMINVYIPLPKDGDGVLNIYDIDSRFGTGVYLHFITDDKVSDYSNIIINIINCEKIRIDSSITSLVSGPIINVLRSCLYYDAGVINYIRTCDYDNLRAVAFPTYSNFTGFDNLTLWYARFSDNDPDILVNGMEVSQPNVAMAAQDISFWDETISDDNHYSYALRSITLSNSGVIVACSLYVSNNSTQTVNTTQHIIIGGKFVLPQGSSLNYPVACLNSPLQITGTFTTAYLDRTETKWITTETSFTARSGIYSFSTGMADGSIAFDSKTDLIDTTYTNVTSIDGWEPGAYHIFYGGTTV